MSHPAQVAQRTRILKGLSGYGNDTNWLPVCGFAIEKATVCLGLKMDNQMKIKRIEHVAVAVKNLQAMRDVLENKLGIEMEYEEHLPEHKTSLAMFPVGETYIELLQSDAPDSATSKWIEQNGEGLFHLCLEVDDIDQAMAELRAKGMTFKQDEPMLGHGNCRIAFLEESCTGNLLIELAEMPKDGQGH
ncbi:MAG: methylmalonyl-CoA/ethylmalonyl-CoA epimerase [Hyphomicrobiaceae bacterium]